MEGKEEKSFTMSQKFYTVVTVEEDLIKEEGVDELWNEKGTHCRCALEMLGGRHSDIRVVIEEVPTEGSRRSAPTSFKTKYNNNSIYLLYIMYFLTLRTVYWFMSYLRGLPIIIIIITVIWTRR